MSKISSLILIVIGALIAVLGIYNIRENSSFLVCFGFILVGGLIAIYAIWVFPEDKKYKCKNCQMEIKNIKNDYCSNCGKLFVTEEVK